MAQDAELSHIEARATRLSIYNGEKPAPHSEDAISTGFRDEIGTADETVESMAEAAAVSHLNDENEDEDEDHDTASIAPSILSGTTAGGKKKKKRRPKSKRGIGKPTGFEEYYAEGPLTPAQHAQDLELYDPKLPFITRILTAIQRFERAKRMESQRRDVFYKYLAYGGIDIGPSMFQGAIDTESFDKDTMNAALTQTSIGQDKYNLGTPDAKYTVDFTSCVKGFLSRRAIYYYGFETVSQVELVTNLLEKFMSYLLQHSVCPEYDADICEARAVSQKATDELFKIAQAQQWLPGDFNIACSTLFGGTYSQRYDGVTSWDPDPTEVTDPKPSFIGFTRDVAFQIVGLAIATVGTEKQYEDFVAGPSQNDAFEVCEVKELAGFEITDIIPVTDEHLRFYTSNSKDYRPVGIVYAKPWLNTASAGLEDLTSVERQERDLRLADPLLGAPSWQVTETYTLFVEGSAQQFMFVGMKLEATLRKLRCGIWFMDEFLQAFPSFDTWICNELMVGWKEPRVKKGVVCYRTEEMGELEEGDETDGQKGDGEGDAELE